MSSGEGPTDTECLDYLERTVWGEQAKCPYCKSIKSTPVKKESRHHCNKCHTTYSVMVGTPFKHSHLPLTKWFEAVALIIRDRRLSARELARRISVNKKTGLKVMERVQMAMLNPDHRALLLSIEQDFGERYVRTQKH